MSAARSIQLFGIYLLLIGIPQVLFPEAFYRAFQIELPGDHSSLILAAVTVVLGFYYLVCARANVTVFFQATVAGRLFVSAVAVYAVLKGMAAPTILTHFTIEVVAALATARALWREGEMPVPLPARRGRDADAAGTEPPARARPRLRAISEDKRFVEIESDRIARQQQAG